MDSDVKEQIEIEGKYKGYLDRQQSDINLFIKDESVKIPENFDYENCPYDLIVIVKKKYLENSYQENKCCLEKLIKKAII